MKNSFAAFLSFILVTIFSVQVYAQIKTPSDDQLYKKRLVKAIDLREKQNQPLYAQNLEFSALLLNYAKSGLLTIYKNDSLNSTLNFVDLKQKLSLNNAVNWSDTLDMDTEEIEDFKSQFGQSIYYSGRDLYQLEINQDWIINNKKSVLAKNIQSLTLFIPADHPDNIKGIQEPVATFDFSECLSLWEQDPKAIWFNPMNDAEHINLAHAFRLELYHSYLIKVSNPNDAYIMDNFEGQSALYEGQNQEAKLLDYESTLWEN